MSRNTPGLGEVITGAVMTRLAELNVAIPGKVVTYDRERQEASIQPLIRRAYVNADGDRVAESLPIIPGVPVLFPGGGSFSMTWPLAAGDLVLLVFCHNSLDKWLEVGGEVDPVDDRRFALSDAVAIPGLRTFRDPDTNTHATAMVVSAPAEIHVGGDSALALANHTHSIAGLSAGGDAVVGTLGASDSNTTKLKGS